ncbi:MAG: hypothetical protein J6W51_07355 [Fibrobacter sp.]|nr:hypothetical protein [Fibrobacter sp.]
MKKCAKNQAEESLKAFKKRIRKMTLDELYDELDAAEKAESNERIDIIIKRMDKLEPIEQKKKEIEKNRKRIKDTFVYWPFCTILGGFYITLQFFYFHKYGQFLERHKRLPYKALTPEVLLYTPYVSFVIGFLLAYFWSYLQQKQRALDLGITGLCLSKGALGLIVGSYPGFFMTPGAFLSRFIACIVATLSLVFMYNVFMKKQAGRFYDSAWPLLLITIAIEQIGWLEHL